jgi:hypothetical protein
MFSLDDAFLANSRYLVQKDFYSQAFGYAFAVAVWVEFFRSQVAEINVLQLVPGLYLFLLFFAFVFMVLLSYSILQLSFEIDNRKSSGTKTVNRLEVISLSRFTFSIAFTQILGSLNSIIPVALDSFNTYGERTLENLWSLDEVLGLELFLLFVILVLSQFPIIALLNLSDEVNTLSLPSYWKPLGILIFTGAGIVTPTIDGFTQLSFSFLAFSLYILVIIVMTRRLNVKYIETSTFGS